MHFEAAVKAGKHVFMEKPVATDAPGVRRVLAANEIAKAKNLAVQVGLQRHHESKYKEGIKRIQDGAIGDICSLVPIGTAPVFGSAIEKTAKPNSNIKWTIGITSIG